MNKNNWKLFYRDIVERIRTNQIGDEFFSLMKSDNAAVFSLTDEELEELIEIPNRNKKIKREVQKILKENIKEETQLFSDELANSYFAVVAAIVCSRDKRYYSDERLCRVVKYTFSMFKQPSWLSLSAPFESMVLAGAGEILPKTVFSKIEKIIEENYEKLILKGTNICSERYFREEFQKSFPFSVDFIKKFKQYFTTDLMNNKVFKENREIQEIFLTEIIPEKLNTLAEKVSHGRAHFDMEKIVPDPVELTGELLLLNI